MLAIFLYVWVFPIIIQASRAYAAGSYEEAVSASRKALIWNIIGTIVGPIMVIVIILVAGGIVIAATE